MSRRLRALTLAVAAATCGIVTGRAQQMPSAKEISGVPREASDLPAGAVSVRVVRGVFTSNITDQPVTFTIDGKTRTIKTDESGRAQVSQLASGTRIRASTVVGSEKLESQEFTLRASGVRVVLVATDPESEKREAENTQLAAAPAVRGIVALGPESRVVVQLDDELLHIFYVVEILNSARTPVDIGGPLDLALPRAARGATLLDGTTPKATVKSGHVIVSGPFAPGSTMLQVAFELPFFGNSVELVQKMPAALSQLNVFVALTWPLDVRSPQIEKKQTVNDQNGQAIMAVGPGIAEGQSFALEITGLPHHAIWPRYVALGLAGGVMTLGIGAAIGGRPRRRMA